MNIEPLFRAPYALPNGLQVTDDGLWIVDQMTDRAALGGDCGGERLRGDTAAGGGSGPSRPTQAG